MKRLLLISGFLGAGCATAQKTAMTVEKALEDAAAVASGPCASAIFYATTVCQANPPQLP